jgi:hypothetical protein
MPTETLSFSLRDVDGIPVLDFKGGGCRPASDAEIELLAEIERLRAELEKAREATFEDAARIADGFATGTGKASRMARAIASALRNTSGSRDRMLSASPVPQNGEGE